MRPGNYGNCWLVLVVWMGTILLFPATVLGQRGANWKQVRIEANYAAAVSVSPRGNVLIKHGDSRGITIYNGFSRGQILAPEENNYRVYESRTGQLWSMDSKGLTLYFRGSWSRFEFPELERELARNPLRQLRQIPLLPSEMNHVLVLLSDGLFEYDAGNRRATLLKRASETKLGRFLEMQESPDGTVWISGTHGLARLAGPVRHISTSTEWLEFLVPEKERYAHFQRPYAGANGVVTGVCSSPEGSIRYLFQLAGGQWSFYEVHGERPRQGWTGWDEQFWAYSYNSIFRVEPEKSPVIHKEPAPGAHFDVAVQTNGVFWIASSDGVIRFSPFLWRTPAALQELEIPVQALFFSMQTPGSGWLASSEGFHLVGANLLQTMPWPEEFQDVQSGGQILQLKDGRLVIAQPRGGMIFDPLLKSFGPLPFGETTAAFLGQLRNGDLVVKLFEPGGVTFSRWDGQSLHPLFPEEPPEYLKEASLFHEARSGDWWFGGPHGMVLYQVLAQSFEVHGIQQGFFPERVLSLAETTGNKILAGGVDRLFEWNGKRWEPILTGLDRVLSIHGAEDGTIWVGTGNGVFRRVGDSWIYHGLAEGLPAITVYKIISDHKRQIWAATSRGVAAYHPDADPDPPRTLDPVLVQSQTPSTTEPTVISFRAIDKWDYTDPKQLLFSYRLNEGPWSPYTAEHSRSFSHLTSGEHRLEVRAMDKNGNVDPLMGVIEFTVIVPWFRDPRLIAVLVFAAALILFFAALAVNKHLQLRRSYAEIEQIVQERTQELERANKELLHSQKMKAIGTMAAGVAHDFNNILSIIKGSAQIIEANPHDEQKIKTRVNRIQTVVEQGSSIVQALLGLGRLDDKDLVSCAPTVILEETRRLLSDRFGEKVQLLVEADAHLPSVRCSKELVQRILINLVLNAADAIGGKGSIILKGELAKHLPEELVLEPRVAESYLLLAVVDEGVGIQPENLSRIFEPFFTTKAFSSRRGTGLGLSMVYQLAKSMGYGLGVRSTVGRGSTFTLLIPVTESPVAI